MVAIMVAIGLMAPLAAQALGEPVWLQINAGAGTYGMSDLNREIGVYNAASAGTGMNFPLVHSGMSLGGAVAYETPNHWNFGVGLDRLYATSEASNATSSIRYELTANAWRLFGEYALRPLGVSSFHVGAGIGILAEFGKATFSETNTDPLEQKMGGSAAMYDAYAGGDWWTTPQLAVTGSLGYRYAKLSSVSVEGGTLINAGNGKPTGVDYSGPYLRLGVKLANRNTEMGASR
jgi:hypothetical protein